MRDRIVTITIAVAAVIVFYIPFIDKPIHIDDTTFISMSEAVRLPFGVKPGVEAYFLGQTIKNMSPFSSVHPVLIPYMLKLIKSITGSDKEYIYHFFFLIFPLLLLISLKGVCGELGIPFLPALLFIMGSIAYLPVSHNLMADAPTFSLLTLFVFLFIRGQRVESAPLTALSSFVLILAAAASYQAGFFMILSLTYLLLFKRDKKVRILFFLIPLLFLAGVVLYLEISHHFLTGLMRGGVKRGLNENVLGGKVLSLLVCLGAIALFINPVFFVNGSTKKYKIKSLYMGLLSFIASSPVMFVRYPFIERLWLLVLVSSGVFFTVRISFGIPAPIGKERKKIIVFFLLWFYLVLGYNVLLMPFGALRYMLPLLLPAVILPMLITRARSGLVYAAAVMTAVMGVTVAAGDYIFASSYRDLSGEVRETVGRNNDRVWFIGDWGIQYYMRRNGYRYLTAKSNEPRKDDLIFVSHVQRIWGPSPPLFQRIRLIDELRHESRFPVRVMGLHARAGYYSHLWGYLPFTLSYGPVERFGVFRVMR